MWAGAISKTTTRRHQKTHTEPKPFACTEPGCTERFSKRNQLDRHNVTHTGGLPYPCTYEDCTAQFNYPSERKKHIDKVHLFVKNYICGHPGCTEAFQTHNLLIRHQREKHAEEYQCDQCQKEFSTLERLEQHKKTHDIANPETLVSCVECGKSFVKKSNLKAHIRAAHEGVTFDCEQCDSKFKHKRTLLKHMRKHERDEASDQANAEVERPKKKARREEKNPVDLLVGPTPPRVTVTSDEDEAAGDTDEE